MERQWGKVSKKEVRQEQRELNVQLCLQEAGYGVGTSLGVHAWLQPLHRVPAEGTLSCIGKGTGWGHVSKSPHMFHIICTFFVGSPVKNPHSQPPFSEGRASGKGIWAAALSKVKNKGKAALVRKASCLCSGYWLQHSEDQWILKELTWVSRQSGRLQLPDVLAVWQ